MQKYDGRKNFYGSLVNEGLDAAVGLHDPDRGVDRPCA